MQSVRGINLRRRRGRNTVVDGHRLEGSRRAVGWAAPDGTLYVLLVVDTVLLRVFDVHRVATDQLLGVRLAPALRSEGAVPWLRLSVLRLGREEGAGAVGLPERLEGAMLLD